ncbi:CdaR family transcriptional regulator [Gracilibacillus phocaeensis]|uniref:CdaR family transcriptional regulator n=1 Tax=Gracilibacillus phocaeensis TaxID=2042304 RepID=UPI0010326F74|nr:sugar diacid recognition domain-containing protein [Gracilibacillus phocaeensis]
MIRSTLANNILNKVRDLLDEDLIIVDTDGVIMASTEAERIGNFHEGASITCQHKSTLTITKADEKKLQGVKAGINLPIFFNDQIVGVIGITGDPAKVSAYGELLRQMTELIVKENYYVEQAEWQARSLEIFVFDWINQTTWSPSFIQQADILLVNLSCDRQVIMGRYQRKENEWLPYKSWSDLISQFFQHTQDVIVRWGNERFLILSAGNKNTAQIKQKLTDIQAYFYKIYKQEIVFGVGQSLAAHQLYQSFHQAERALGITNPAQPIIFEETMQLEMCLQDVTQASRIELVRRTLEPIIADQTLLDCLQTFIDHGQSLKQTAASLHIHINTLHYRFKKMEQLTGLNPRDFHDLITLSIALYFLEDYLKFTHKNA